MQITGTTLANDATGNVSFTVKVTDSANNSVSAQATISVSALVALSIQTPMNLPTAILGQSYSGSINAQGGVPPYTWAPNPTVGSLPAGLSLGNLNGSTLQITGTTLANDATGNVSFSFKVTHSENNSTTAQATITVSAPVPLTITTTQHDVGNGLVGAPYSAWINVSGGSGNSSNYVFSIASGNLPTGLNFSLTNNGEITGVPTATGSYPFTVQVADSSANQTAQQAYTIVIASGPDGENNPYLYGNYAFLFRGFVDASNGGGALYESASIGSFHADGNGNISNVQFQINDGNSGGTIFAPMGSGVTGPTALGRTTGAS